jgi:hypothetical protein
MMIAVWSRKRQSSTGRICRVQNILAPTFDMIATNQEILTDVNLRLISLFRQIVVEHGK